MTQQFNHEVEDATQALAIELEKMLAEYDADNDADTRPHSMNTDMLLDLSQMIQHVLITTNTVDPYFFRGR